MKTKLVYVVVSTDKDIYLEQAWVSAFSAKYHNPTAKVVFVTDEDTYNGIIGTERKNVMSVVDELVPVHIDGKLSNMKRSRWIKTNLRNLIDGDFLFVDTDTVVTGDLSAVDGFTMSIGAVYDLHCTFDKFPYAVGIIKQMKTVFGCIPNHGTSYFNSGTIYAKDDDISRSFFTLWHDNWLHSCTKGVATDQLSMMKTCDSLHCVSPMSGDYNCQVLGSIQYLYTAKIVHFFNAKWNDNTLCPFFGNDVYRQVKKDRGISGEVKNMVLHCKELFVSPSIPISGNDVDIWNSQAFNLLRWLNNNSKNLYRSVVFVARCAMFVIKKLPLCFINKSGGVKCNTSVRLEVCGVALRCCLEAERRAA